ncbi:NAD(P)H-dependent oxidoreductase [Bifidobacterium pullorum subsp. saeculare]|uniref:NAD(P)H-dependent oxidoreductase n=1 Tax=Bifidobacterium pullorum subsp. saeculare TaxID=78257 RepID=A0A938WY18_9BIFI|nr:flavodoxin [Bifidobacterium pullorum]MBM6699757.1 NAD(P)H-dependent oxidoreductase [Bifidobacterium pullorum subsp. saeculare]
MLVVDYSRAGENYAVGVVAEGSTHRLARVIAEEAGCALVDIGTVEPYPLGYEEAKAVIQRELETGARPAVRWDEGMDGALADARAVALGYPIWCGSLPAPVRSFLDAVDLDGRIILPFCTHGGSGFARTLTELRDALPAADIRPGLAVLGEDAQRDPESLRPRVAAWLGGQPDV